MICHNWIDWPTTRLVVANVIICENRPVMGVGHPQAAPDNHATTVTYAEKTRKTDTLL